MRIKPIYNFKLILPGYVAITLYPFILFRHPKDQVKYTTFKHEMIHVGQIRDIGFFSFYLSYLLYYIAGLLNYKDHQLAYYTIPYEICAHDYEKTPLTIEQAEELCVD